MTATAFALDPALDPRLDVAFDPAFDIHALDVHDLDMFDDVDGIAPRRPELRLIQGEGCGRIIPATTTLAPGASVEIYRRRRFFALIAITALVLGIAWAAGLSVTSFSAAPASPALVDGQAAPLVHVVLPGDSYAAIAADLGATNPVVAGDQLRVANGGSELVIGQRLVVDASVLTVVG